MFIWCKLGLIRRHNILAFIDSFPNEWNLFIYFRGILPYENDGGGCRKIFESTPKRYQNLILWAWLRINLHPYEVPILKY